MPSPLLAFGISNLPMLGWLAAAAAPLLIHLLSRRKYRETSWAAMEYLLAALKRRARHIQIEQWLLLALRTLLIVIAVVAVAEPFVERANLPLLPGSRVHRVLVIDGSYSMAYRAADKSRLDRAKEIAAKIVDESVQGDAFTLVLMAAPPRVIVGAPSAETAPIREEIAHLGPVDSAADLPATVAAIHQLLANAHRDNSRLDHHEVYFFTDLQRSTWSPALGEDAAAEFRQQTEQLAQVASLRIIDLGQPTGENLAVSDLRTTEPVALAGRSVAIEAQLRNFGHQPHPRQAVELLVDGQRVAQQPVDVGAEGQTAVRFSWRWETPGDHLVEIRANGDALAVDNRRFLVVSVRPSLRVLCVDGHPRGEPHRGAGDYLAAALSPVDDRAESRRVVVEVTPETSLLERDLGLYDCIFLANVAQFTSSEARALNAYLSRGGGLVFFLGDQVLADRYNAELTGEKGRTAILPARLGEVVSRRQSRLDPLDYLHPIVQAFKGREKAGLLTTPVEKFFKLQLRPASSARIALAVADGDPLVVTDSVRRGRVVLVGTSADTSWTPMPLWPSFLPIVQEIVAWCVEGQSQQRNLVTGEPLGGVLAGATQPDVSVEIPDGPTRAAAIHSEGEERTWTFSDTWRSGFYKVHYGPTAGDVRAFGVNVDVTEGNLNSITADELRSEVWPGVPFVCQSTWHHEDSGVAAPVAGPGRLHVGLLYGVVGMLLLETLLAWRFGHYSP